MKAPSILHRHPALGWLVPSAVVVALGLLATGVFTSQSSTVALAETNPQALLAAISTPDTGGFSGTILAQMSLGLPDLSGVDASDDATNPDTDTLSDSTALLPLISGAHTMRYWYGGPDRQRVAMFGATSETDVFRDGNDVWQWDSDSQVAVHSTAATATASLASAPLTLASLTPQQLTERTLAAIDGATDVAIDTPRQIAYRSSYELVITPQAGTPTRIGSVHIGIDGQTKVPLSVQVYARGASVPSVDVSFTSVTFKMPSADYFSFSPPSGATVQTIAQSRTPLRAATAVANQVPGAAAGWTQVSEYRLTVPATGLVAMAAPLVAPVSGAWGKGHLLDLPLLCVLVVNDGRVYLGAVDPTVLYAAAAAH